MGERTRKSFRYKPSSRLYTSATEKKISLVFDCNVIANTLDIFTINPQFICKFTLATVRFPKSKHKILMILALDFALKTSQSRGKTA